MAATRPHGRALAEHAIRAVHAVYGGIEKPHDDEKATKILCAHAVSSWRNSERGGIAVGSAMS